MENKKYLIPIAALVLLGGLGFTGIKTVSAQAAGQTHPLVTKIAEKFNLNVDDVQQVFDEERDARQQERQADLEEKLSTAVSEGKITEEQKTALLEKMAQHPEENQNMGELTGEERKAYMDQQREEFQTWLDEQGIDMSELDLGFGPKGDHGRGGHFGEPGEMGNFSKENTNE